IAEIFAEIPENLAQLTEKLNVNLRRLPQAELHLAQWRTEFIPQLVLHLPHVSDSIEHDLMDPPTFIDFSFYVYKLAFRELLLQHYTEGEVQAVMPRERARRVVVHESPFAMAVQAIWNANDPAERHRDNL